MNSQVLINPSEMKSRYREKYVGYIYLSAARVLFGNTWRQILKENGFANLYENYPDGEWGPRMRTTEKMRSSFASFLMERSHLSLAELTELGERAFLSYEGPLLRYSDVKHTRACLSAILGQNCAEDGNLLPSCLKERRELINREIAQLEATAAEDGNLLLSYLKERRELLNKEIARLEDTAAEEERKKKYTELAIERVKLLDKRDLARRAVINCEERVKEIEKELGL